MSRPRKRPTLGVVIYFALAASLGTYFTFAAVQGDYGVFSRVQVDSEARTLRVELAALSEQVLAMQNKTRRLSDEYLDLDLLDEQVRRILGMIRADEIVIH